MIGTASDRNHDYLRSLDAVPVSYGSGLVERIRTLAPDGVDAALDAAGTEEALRASLQLASDKGRVATVAYTPVASELGVRRLSTERSVEQLTRLSELYTAGQLRAEIRLRTPLEQAAEAHRAVETGHVRGKVVLTI